MSHNPMHHVVHHMAKHIAHERAHGNGKKANALTCILLGVCLLPIPFIGLPLIATGLYKLKK